MHFIFNDSRCTVLSSVDGQWLESRDNVTWSVVPCCFEQYSVSAVVCSTREYKHLKLICNCSVRSKRFYSATLSYSAVYAVVAFLPSARLFVTSRCCIKTAKDVATQTTPYDSSGTLVFWCQRSRQNSNGLIPNAHAKFRWGGLKSTNFDQNLAVSQQQCKIRTWLL